MTHTITIANSKGGVGKTTTAIAIAAGLAEQGRRTLLVDIDAQANCTQSLRLPPEAADSYSLLHGRHGQPVEVAANLWAIGSTKDMIAAADEIQTMKQGTAIATMLQPFRDLYEFIVIDTPPATGLLTMNAILCADFVLIPLQASYLAAQGVGQLYELLQKIDRADAVGIVLTMYDKRKTLHRQIYEAIQRSFGGMVFSSTIRNNIAIAEAPATGRLLYDYAPKSNGAADYRALTAELLQRMAV